MGFFEGLLVLIFDGTENVNNFRNFGGIVKGSLKNGLVDSKIIVWGVFVLVYFDLEDKEFGSVVIFFRE